MIKEAITKMYRSSLNCSAKNNSDPNIENTFRQLWEQHVMWTRSFIISTAANLGDLQLVTQRLLRNPGDFAVQLRKYYGYEKANKFKDLLEQHLLTAADLVNAAKAGDLMKVNESRRKWYQNADEIADFLSGINPYWNKQVWKNLLYSHLQMTENEATYRLNSQYASDIAEYDEIENEALRMADYMAEGIKKQFSK